MADADENYEDEYFDEEEEDDLTDVEDPTYPANGWHKVKITSTSMRPTKKGAKRRSVCMNFANGYSHWEGFIIGLDGQAGQINKRNYKAFAQACGMEENDEGKFSFKLKDFVGAQLYVLAAVNPEDDFPVRIKAYRSITDAPDEVQGDGEFEDEAPSTPSDDDDDLPF